jgi:hypothetical protein
MRGQATSCVLSGKASAVMCAIEVTETQAGSISSTNGQTPKVPRAPGVDFLRVGGIGGAGWPWAPRMPVPCRCSLSPAGFHACGANASRIRAPAEVIRRQAGIRSCRVLFVWCPGRRMRRGWPACRRQSFSCARSSEGYSELYKMRGVGRDPAVGCAGRQPPVVLKPATKLWPVGAFSASSGPV